MSALGYPTERLHIGELKAPPTTQSVLRSRIREVVLEGLLVWSVTTIPYCVGMFQCLADKGSRQPGGLECLFIAGGCCAWPLVFLFQAYFIWVTVRLQSFRGAATLAILSLITYGVLTSGI